MQEWNEKEGTKLSLLLKLIQHSLSHDTRDPVSFDEEGGASYPEIPLIPLGETAPQDSKILVYQEFPMMAEMIISVRAALSPTAALTHPNRFWISTGSLAWR
jgi:hypothetical protein